MALRESVTAWILDERKTSRQFQLQRQAYKNGSRLESVRCGSPCKRRIYPNALLQTTNKPSLVV